MAKSANSGEKYLLDALDRVARNPVDYSVLYVNISKLKPKNRHPEFVKIFARMFDSIVGVIRGQMFVLSNGDFAILGKNITEDTVDEAVKKIRSFTVEAPKILRSCIIFPKTILRSMSRFKICTKMTIMRFRKILMRGSARYAPMRLMMSLPSLIRLIFRRLSNGRALCRLSAGKIPGCVSGIFCGGQGFERTFGQEP